jgi:5'-methylthioadenosine phosphorylase
VLVDQFIDRGQHRQATFFGEGVVAHIAFADPVCPDLRANVLRVMAPSQARVHDRGTYLCMEGPAFSTRAESELYRSWKVDVIGMTNMHEAKLCREAEICYATLALVTDYDCWHEEEDDVSVAALLDNLKANSQLAAEVVRETVRTIQLDRGDCGCSEALRHALITPAEAVPRATLKRLSPILGKYVKVP